MSEEILRPGIVKRDPPTKDPVHESPQDTHTEIAVPLLNRNAADDNYFALMIQRKTQNFSIVLALLTMALCVAYIALFGMDKEYQAETILLITILVAFFAFILCFIVFFRTPIAQVLSNVIFTFVGFLAGFVLCMQVKLLTRSVINHH